jgi:hypothetical protein
VQPGSTVAVVGDGAVGLCGVLAAKRLGADRIIALSRHESRQAVARAFGATDIVPERGHAAAEGVRALTDGLGAPHVLECVGFEESMTTAIQSARRGGSVGFVGVPHLETPKAIRHMFNRAVGLRGSGAFVRCLMPVHLTGGGTIEYSVWLRVGADEVRHASEIWEAPAYADLRFEGTVANAIRPWADMLGAPAGAKALSHDPGYRPARLADHLHQHRHRTRPFERRVPLCESADQHGRELPDSLSGLPWGEVSEAAAAGLGARRSPAWRGSG